MDTKISNIKILLTSTEKEAVKKFKKDKPPLALNYLFPKIDTTMRVNEIKRDVAISLHHLIKRVSDMPVNEQLAFCQKEKSLISEKILFYKMTEINPEMLKDCETVFKFLKQRIKFLQDTQSTSTRVEKNNEPGVDIEMEPLEKIKKSKLPRHTNNEIPDWKDLVEPHAVNRFDLAKINIASTYLKKIERASFCEYLYNKKYFTFKPGNKLKRAELINFYKYYFEQDPGSSFNTGKKSQRENTIKRLASKFSGHFM